MKNIVYIIVSVLIVFTIPQITFAAWWNPLTWFDNWNFSSTYNKDQTEELKNRILELEDRIQDANNATSTINTIEKDTKNTNSSINEVNVKKDKPISNPILVPTITPVIKSVPIVQTPVDFRGKCVLSKEVIDAGDTVRVQIDLLDKISNFDIYWDKKNLTRIIDENEALYNPIETRPISITVIRKSDGYSKIINCNVWVNEEKTAEELRESSPECKEAKSLLNKIEDEIEPIQDKLDQYYDEYLKTGKYSNSNDNSDLHSKLADLSLRKSGVQSDYYYACKGFVPSSPKIYNTNCYELYGTLHCSTY